MNDLKSTRKPTPPSRLSHPIQNRLLLNLTHRTISLHSRKTIDRIRMFGNDDMRTVKVDSESGEKAVKAIVSRAVV